ncbi:MAG: hypothetical protein SFV51_16160 [Bryobacteraceae bacterium]|nr:hypothetical protein [Bryobacteraceae bacterium]
MPPPPRCHFRRLRRSTAGPALPAAEVINSGCTIVVGPGAKLAVKEIAVNFAGPLTIRSPGNAAVMFKKAPWRATSVSIALPGSNSELISKESRLAATAGNVAISVGDMLSGLLNGASVQAGAGIAIRVGAESSLKLSQSDLLGGSSPITIAGTGPKVALDLGQGTFRSTAGFSVVVATRDSSIAIKDGTFDAGAGSILLQAGASTLTIQAGILGTAMVDDVQLDGRMGVLVHTSGRGSTLVKNSRGSSLSEIAVRGRAVGVCVAEGFSFSAPDVVLCPSPLPGIQPPF